MELGLESLKSRRWFKRLSCMFKIMKNQAPEQLNNIIPKRKQSFNSRYIYILRYNCRTEYFKTSFFPASFEEWFHLDPIIKSSKTIYAFKQKRFHFILSLENSIFSIFDPEGLKLLTGLRLGFSHLNEHRFRHNFQKCLNPVRAAQKQKIPLTTYCTAIITLLSY